MNLFIDSVAGVNIDASNDEKSDDENDDLDGYIVADDIDVEVTYYLSHILSYFIFLVHYISHHRPLC